MRLQLISDTLKYGALYALAKADVESPVPLVGASTWNFWTKDRNRLIRYLAENYPPLFFAKHILRNVSDRRNEAGIASHYDASAEFFMLFLDKDYHFYSIADFRSPNETLEQAQANKGEHFLKLIAPRPGDKLLELGCGWGGMMKYLHKGLGDSIDIEGITISQTQANYIRKNYGFKVSVENFVTRKYLANQYDRIYSMEAWDHVRPKDVAPLLKKLYAALKPGGRLVQQFSCAEKPPPGTSTSATYLLGELFFAGMVLMTAADQIAAAVEAGFKLVHDSTPDLRPSCKAWYDRLVAVRDEAVPLVGVQEYNRYLMLLVLSWRATHEKYSTVHRLAFEKPDNK